MKTNMRYMKYMVVMDEQADVFIYRCLQKANLQLYVG